MKIPFDAAAPKVRQRKSILANYASSQVSRSISARYTILFRSQAKALFTFLLFHLHVPSPVNLAYLFEMKLFGTELADGYPNRLKLTKSKHLLCVTKDRRNFSEVSRGRKRLRGGTVCRPRVLLSLQI